MRVTAKRTIEVGLTLSAENAALLRATIDQARLSVTGQDEDLERFYFDLSLAIGEALDAEGVVVVAPRGLPIFSAQGPAQVSRPAPAPRPATVPEDPLPTFEMEPKGEARPMGRFNVYDAPAGQIRAPEEIVSTRTVEVGENARPEPTRGLIPKFK